MYKQLNAMQFLHKIELANLTKSVLKIADNNNVTESDICILAGIMYCISGKPDSDIAKLLTDTLLFNKVEIKRMKTSDTSYEVERIKYIAKNFFTTFSAARLSQAFNIPISHIEVNCGLQYNEFILSFLKDTYSGDDDETFIENFIELNEKGDYANCVRMYLMCLVLGRFKLVEKLSLIQNRSFHKNFLYSLNQELISLINLLVRYGRSNKIDLLSEEMMTMCNDAVEELTHKLSEQQYSHVMEKLELTNKIKEQDMIIKNLQDSIKELNKLVEKYKNSKILDGKKVLVIADESHKDGYKEIVERHGGIYEFISGIDGSTNYVVNRAQASDEVFFCTAYAKHKIYFSGLKELNNVHYLTNNGLSSLENEICKLR